MLAQPITHASATPSPKRHRVLAAVLLLGVILSSAGCAGTALTPAAAPTPPAATATATAPASAVLTAANRDDVYLTVLDDHGIPYSSREEVISVGRFAADLHDEDGLSAETIGTLLLDLGTSSYTHPYTPGQIGAIVGAAIESYGRK